MLSADKDLHFWFATQIAYT